MKRCPTIAIIAHVDHGKTTLLDHMLRQSGTLAERGEEVERVMDSNPQERERGITILAKCTAVKWRDQVIQVVDTPGHQDFGGEVERILRMADSVLLIVDAVEGPMPQTRYVTRKALEHNLSPIVVINKMDRPEANPDRVLNEVFDLFVSLGATDTQLEFPVVYGSAKQGWTSLREDTPGEDLSSLFDTIIEHVAPPPVDPEAPLQVQIATLDYSNYLGRIAIGRIHAGSIQRGSQAVLCRRDGSQTEFRVSKLMGFLGLSRVDRENAVAGEIVALAGIENVTVGDTICHAANPIPLPLIPIDAPTIAMRFSTNTSPFAGKEGDFVTSRQVRERIDRELEHNVGLQVQETDRKDIWLLLGRGTLHLSVLIEDMRREGFEMSVGQPEVVKKDGQEPFESVTVTVPAEFCGTVIEKLSRRGGTLKRHDVDGEKIATLELDVPSRGLIGYRSEFLTDTRGEGIIYHAFSHYAKVTGSIPGRGNGALIALETCTTAGYALNNLQERGRLFVGPGEAVYAGQVVGLHSRTNDLVINPGKKKQQTNVRASGHDEAIRLTPPIRYTLEEALEGIMSDELVEVTPKSIRIRKIILDHSERKRSEKGS